jgi:hypothetical protein
MPDPLEVAQKALQCGDASASCMQDVWDAAAPALSQPLAPSGPPQHEPSAGAPQPEPSAGAPQPEPSTGSKQPKGDSGESPDKSAGQTPRTNRERARVPGSGSPASQPELAEIAASPRLVQGPGSLPPPPAPEVAQLRGPDPVSLPTPGAPAAPGPGLDWSPLLLYMFLASASVALLFFLPTAAPHSLARISYQLAERRYDLGLIGVVMFVGLAIGYLVAVWVG